MHYKLLEVTWNITGILQGTEQESNTSTRSTHREYSLSTMAKRARLSVNQVIDALDATTTEDFECYDENEDAEYEFDADEPIMEGSDDEFGELDDELRDQIEVQMDDENTVEDCVAHESECDGGYLGLTEDIEESTEEESTEEESADAVLEAGQDLPTEWSTELKPVIIPPFSSPVGPTVPVPDTALSIFEMFFTPSILRHTVTQSNTYAQQVLGDGFDRYQQLTVEELRAYFGFCMLMAVNRLPATEDYWKRDPIYNYTPIASRISRDRFREIGRYLHFVDNGTLAPLGDPAYDRLGKIRPLIDHLSSRFRAVYSPHRDVAVDEAMIKFQGRSSLKQYMPLKPTKRGIKVWVLGDSHNGYFWKFQVYTGKQGDAVERGLPARVVKSLTEDLKGDNYHVYFDNFFNSFALLNDLLGDNIFACGTARSNRIGFPEALKNIKFAKRYTCTYMM